MKREKRKLMGVEEWQRRLEDTFRINGGIGFELQDIINAEKQYGRDAIGYFRGYRVLQNSFQGFFIETLKLAFRKMNELQATDGANIIPWAFRFILLQQVRNFRGLRAAEILFLRGYPFAGYSQLRDLKDRAVFMLALTQGVTTPEALFGVDDEIERMMPHALNTEQRKRKVQDKAKENRKGEERRIFDLMMGDKSGVSKDARTELKNWRNVFHDEVHGGKLSLASEIEMLNSGGEMTIGPKLNQNPDTLDAMYLNRSYEIGWMFHRTAPGMQLQPGSFGKEWADKWIILDESFKHINAELGNNGKPQFNEEVHHQAGGYAWWLCAEGISN